MASDDGDSCAIVSGVLGGLFAITTLISVSLIMLSVLLFRKLREECICMSQITVFCSLTQILPADKTKSGQGNGGNGAETVYEDPLPNLSSQGNDLQMKTCSAYGVLNTN